MSRILLRHLNLQHLIGFFQSPKQRRNCLPDLEVHRAVFNLQNHILVIVSIHLNEIVISGTRPVRLIIPPVLRAVINKAPPDDDGAIFLHNIGKHIGSVCLRPSVGKRPGSSFRICLYKEPSKIRDSCKDLLHLLFPPCNDLFV